MAWLFIFVVVAFVGIVCLPLAVIWSMNTLFEVGIEFNVKTWAASFILLGLFAANYSGRSN
jgi:hypothetical protein